MFRIFKRNKTGRYLQGKENRNRTVLNFLIASGFSLPAIRKALMVLNEYPMGVLKSGVASQASVTRTMQSTGKDLNPMVMKQAAERLELTVEELFPKVVNER